MASSAASYFSPDLFLDWIDIVIIFLRDGAIEIVDKFYSKGRVFECGDSVQFSRSTECGQTKESAIVLGWGESRDDAVSASRSYFERLAKWHGHEGDLSSFQLFGYDCSQSEILWRPQPCSGDDSSTPSSEDPDDSESLPSPKRKQRKIN